MQQPTESPGRAPRRLTDPASMRALSHPVRLALIEVLTLRGALTATQAGELIDETPTTCSFHLRQLAKYGFVEEAGPMPGRSRPWRITRLGWSLENEAPDGTTEAREHAVAARHLGDMTLERQLDRHRSHDHGAERAHTVWWVTPDEAAELRADIDELVMRYRDRLQDPAARPPEAEAVEVVVLTHPFA
ncbi:MULTISPECIES: helix-turn-helix domain-containing protein [unclassified Streptomyces]|uniref:winged helix-turn-helix domain-containing protein n=1 Tax=unclassified Streptomyces TaxID=2593676 RepID=UPI0007C89551|nr:MULTISPECIES: helix-turn-helix domain-containing protein [unclassified Streptomyces]